MTPDRPHTTAMVQQIVDELSRVGRLGRSKTSRVNAMAKMLLMSA